jgi:glycosyltransferase involved in cell wall biosynthesis
MEFEWLFKESQDGRSHRPRLLVVGPLPPPISGTGVSFQLFCDEIQRREGMPALEIIDSSPGKLKQASRATSASNYAQAWRIVSQYCRKVFTVDQVLIFGSQGFLLLMLPLLLLVAKVARKPCYVRAFGGSLDRFYDELNPLARRSLLCSLRRADGLLVQTNLLYQRFVSLIGDSVYLVPGYRPVDTTTHAPPKASIGSPTTLRLIFLGHVREEKGIFVLLESLRRIHADGRSRIQCDIFGPIFESIATRFENELAQTPNASYGGILGPDVVVATLRAYDALIFPSFFDGEGHPGVLVETMMAGIPAIATAFRSIPELVDDRVNGLLVAPGDADSLAEAIKTIDEDRQLLAKMARRNWERRTSYAADRVIPQILQPLGIGVPPNRTSEQGISES